MRSPVFACGRAHNAAERSSGPGRPAGAWPARVGPILTAWFVVVGTGPRSWPTMVVWVRFSGAEPGVMCDRAHDAAGRLSGPGRPAEVWPARVGPIPAAWFDVADVGLISWPAGVRFPGAEPGVMCGRAYNASGPGRSVGAWRARVGAISKAWSVVAGMGPISWLAGV